MLVHLRKVSPFRISAAYQSLMIEDVGVGLWEHGRPCSGVVIVEDCGLVMVRRVPCVAPRTPL